MVRKNNNGIKYYVVISLVAIFGIGAAVIAFSGSAQNNVESCVNCNISGASNEVLEDMNLGAVVGTDVVIDKLIYGDSVSDRLTFKEGATSTGGLFAITNYGPSKVCDKVELDLVSLPTTGGLLGTGVPLSFRVATSTSRTLWGADDSFTLIASTTVPTSTPSIIIDTHSNTGTYATAGTNDGRSFIWGTGISIVGAYNTLPGSNATSTIYSMSGFAYIRCHERN